MTPRTGSRVAPHWTVQRTLLTAVGHQLLRHAEAVSHSYASLGLTPAEWHRLQIGKAGFPLVVKTAGRLGLLVEVVLGAGDRGPAPLGQDG